MTEMPLPSTFLESGASDTQRHQRLLNELLISDAVRHGSLSSALQALIRAFCSEIGVDRVAVAVRDASADCMAFADVYVAATDRFAVPFVGVGDDPMLVFKLGRPGVPIIADDIATNAQLSPFVERLFQPLDARAFLQLPIDVNGSLVGVINATVCGRPWVWTPAQTLLGTAIANLASLVIERDARRTVELERSAAAERLQKQQVALSRLMQHNARHGQKLEAELRALAEEVAATLEVERVSLWRYTPDKQAIVGLEMFDARDGSHSDGLIIRSQDHQPYFSALEREGVVVVDDVSSDERTQSFCESYVPATGVTSILDMTITSNNEPVGVVCAEKCGAPITWREDHKVFLAAVTGLAALAIERHERQKAQAENAATTLRIANHFTVINDVMQSEAFQSGSLETALRHLSSTLCHEIGADGMKLRIAMTERDDAPAYSEIYNAEHRTFITGSPGDLTNRATEADIAWFSRHTAIHDVRSHESEFVRHLPVIKRLNIRTVLQVPIRLHGAVVGFVRAWTCGRTTDWKSSELMVAASIAQLTALVLERQNRMRIESRLRHANNAAEQASRAKSQFLANMSHEIRTPMNGVFGMTDLLLQTPLSLRQSQIIGTIQQSTTALLTIINDILDLSRIEAGRVELEQKPLHLRGCVEGALALFVEDARRRSIALSLTIDRGCPEWLLGDATRLRQVCVNLLSNALKFTQKGFVSLHVEAIEGDGARASLCFTLRDSGIGIDPNVQQRLFHPFAQADGSITRRFGGTGLGLSISRSLIEMMGGTIALDSAPGSGTTITFTASLERVKAPSVAESSAASLTAWFAGPDQSAPVMRRRFGGRVLVAEDNPVNQEVTRELVSALGCAVVCVENGEEAVNAIANQQFDLVLMDCQMPVMDGLTATRRIRALEASAGRQPLKIVAVTANAFAEDRQVCLDAGMDGYLSKPFTCAQLDETLQRWLPAHLVIERRGSAARAAPPPDDVPDFDPIVLEPMKRLRQDFYRRLLSTFLLHTPKLIEAIQEAATRCDRDALRLAAHSLKSSSANVGASRLSALARDTELSASRGTLEEAATKAKQIEAAYQVIADLFAQELADVNSPASATA